jgi:hypothetical protein
MPRRYDNSKDSEIVRRYCAERQSREQIYRALHCSDGIILRVLNSHGVKIRTRSEQLSIVHETVPMPRPKPKFNLSDVVHLYCDGGLTITQIAKQKGCSPCRVSQYLRNLDVTMRRPSVYHAAHTPFSRPRPSDDPDWQGHKVTKPDGYIKVYSPNHPGAGVKGFILEHRLVMEQKIGRPLSKREQVHHINGIRGDNRPENLLLVSPANHRLKQIVCHDCPLRKEVRLLRWELRNLRQLISPALVKDG